MPTSVPRTCNKHNIEARSKSKKMYETSSEMKGIPKKQVDETKEGVQKRRDRES
jgi:hypothetical protein